MILLICKTKKLERLWGFCIEAAAILADKKDLEEKFKNIGIKMGFYFKSKMISWINMDRLIF